MNAVTLEHANALHLDAADGLIHFAGEPALLIDATAMGVLRKSLVENFGSHGARTTLTQLGFAQGWRMAEPPGRRLATATTSTSQGSLIGPSPAVGSAPLLRAPKQPRRLLAP